MTSETGAPRPVLSTVRRDLLKNGTGLRLVYFPHSPTRFATVRRFFASFGMTGSGHTCLFSIPFLDRLLVNVFIVRFL